MKEKIKTFTNQCVRVWHLMSKPSSYEFKTVAKVSALGLCLIGLLGFIITIVMNFIF